MWREPPLPILTHEQRPVSLRSRAPLEVFWFLSVTSGDRAEVTGVVALIKRSGPFQHGSWSAVSPTTHSCLNIQGDEGDPARTGPRCGSVEVQSLQASAPVQHTLPPLPSGACSVELTPAIPDLPSASLTRMTDLGTRDWPGHVKQNPCWSLLGKGQPFPWWGVGMEQECTGLQESNRRVHLSPSLSSSGSWANYLTFWDLCFHIYKESNNYNDHRASISTKLNYMRHTAQFPAPKSHSATTPGWKECWEEPQATGK